MWYTQHERSNVLKIFQFLWVFEFFNTLKNRTCKVRSTKKKVKYKTKLVKETSFNWTCETYKANMHRWTKWGHARDRVQGMISTPMVLRKALNLGPLRGLVNMSTFWLSVLINYKHTIFPPPSLDVFFVPARKKILFLMWHEVFTASTQNFCGMFLLSNITLTISWITWFFL